jgi:hypothetical protein
VLKYLTITKIGIITIETTTIIIIIIISKTTTIITINKITIITAAREEITK